MTPLTEEEVLAVRDLINSQPLSSPAIERLVLPADREEAWYEYLRAHTPDGIPYPFCDSRGRLLFKGVPLEFV